MIAEALIDDIVEAMADKLKADIDYKVCYHEDVEFWGWELLLGGITEIKGKPLVKGNLYRVPIPVITKPDYRHQIRLAFHKAGRPGVMTYLEQHVRKDELPRFRAIVLGNYNEYVTDQVNA